MGTAPPSWLLSAVFHAAVLLVLSLTFAPPEQDRMLMAHLLASMPPSDGDGLEPLRSTRFSKPNAASDVEAPANPLASPSAGGIAPDALLEEPAAQRALVTLGGPRGSLDPLARAGDGVRGGLAGRRGAGRAGLLGEEGGTPDSERAVYRGLKWLAAHQRNDGSWHFNHHLSRCQGSCRDPGAAATTTGATAVALLAFLGAGETHEEGEFQNFVRQGIYYLKGRMLDTPHGGDLQEGTMYAQGLATIALCEAYAMTGDTELAEPAQRAVDFILYAQDPVGGGWRYFPGQPGDTTVLGWQLMALKSAEMAYLIVPPRAGVDAQRFLDGVQSRGGGAYGYQQPGEEPTTTAVGLLCRMIGGWDRASPGLMDGVVRLADWGPSPDNMYYNYYATQVMRHYGGPMWKEWNGELRDRLVREQATEGHENGSWYYPGGRCESGGRLLSTALSVMTLEVYYRYLPLYRNGVFDWDAEE